MPAQLGSRSLDILIALVERAGEVVTNKELVAQVWPGVTIDESGLRVQIAGLRKALAAGQSDARYVTNIAGRGYCFVAPVSRVNGGELPAVATNADLKLPAPLKRMIGRADVQWPVGNWESLQNVLRRYPPSAIDVRLSLRSPISQLLTKLVLI